MVHGNDLCTFILDVDFESVPKIRLERDHKSCKCKMTWFVAMVLKLVLVFELVRILALLGQEVELALEKQLDPEV